MSDKCVVAGCNGPAFFSRYCEYHLRRKMDRAVDYEEKRSPNVSINIEGKEEYDQKATNPKDAIGGKKLPMHLIPGTAKAVMALAFLEGALKYGKYNWRVAGVRSSVYLDALERHLEKYKNGEDSDVETGVPHLGSIMACCAIILDAALCGKLVDDRPPMAPSLPNYIDTLQHHVVHLQKLFEGENPHQCTIQDTFDGVETEQE